MNDTKKVLISIKGSPLYSADEDEMFELMTDGEYLEKNGICTFSYIGSTLTGEEGTLTTFNVEKDKVTLQRNDGINGDMIFTENQKQHFLYNTPFGSVMMGIDTHSIVSNMADDGGNLEIKYDIEVDNVSVSQNLFEINVRSCPQ
ncbi:MAG: DUF1934 domain-containing protein [Oscillospiraceae bacterium]|nr:DUF1934 domain-containing protein [Oscillospiraceae bacterium]